MDWLEEEREMKEIEARAEQRGYERGRREQAERDLAEIERWRVRWKNANGFHDFVACFKALQAALHTQFPGLSAQDHLKDSLEQFGPSHDGAVERDLKGKTDEVD